MAPHYSEHQRTCYRKSGPEKFVYRVCYDLFVAPVIATISALSLFSLHLIILFTCTAISCCLGYYYFEKESRDAVLSYSLLVAAVTGAAISGLMPKIGSPKLGVVVFMSTAVCGLAYKQYSDWPTTMWESVCTGVGAVVGALLYWSLLEDGHSFKKQLADSFSSTSALNLKDTSELRAKLDTRPEEEDDHEHSL